MSGETEIEVSVVSEEDLELEGSRGSSNAADLLDKSAKNCNLFDVSKAALRPACNPQYTSFSISSILGRPESPAGEPGDKHDRSSPTKMPPTCVSPAPRSLSPRLGARHNHLLPMGHPNNATSPLSGFTPTDANNTLIGHQASADFAMLSR